MFLKHTSNCGAKLNMGLPLASCVGLVSSVGQPCVERHHHRNRQTSQILIIKLYYQWPSSVRWKRWTGWNLPSSRRRTKSRCRLCRGMRISGPGTQKMTLTIQLKRDWLYELFFAFDAFLLDSWIYKRFSRGYHFNFYRATKFTQDLENMITTCETSFR